MQPRANYKKGFGDPVLGFPQHGWLRGSRGLCQEKIRKNQAPSASRSTVVVFQLNCNRYSFGSRRR